MDTTKSEIVRYRAAIDSNRPPLDTSPLDFWKSNRLRLPKLSLLARHVLASPQSSAQVERLFSRCGELVSSSRRNRLSSQTLNALLLNAALASMNTNTDEDTIAEEMCHDENLTEEMEQFASLWRSSTPKRRSSSAPPINLII